MIPEGLNPKVERGYRLINCCIIDFIVKEKGSTTFSKIEFHTGLKQNQLRWAVDILVNLRNAGIVNIKGENVTASVTKLTQIMEQEKTQLPNNYGKPWSENDAIILCELANDGVKPAIIAQKLERTEGSISMELTFWRKTGRAIPWIERNKSIRDFVNKHTSPNPER